MQENLTWLAVGLVTAAYITQRHQASARRKATDTSVQLSAQNEVDPTRWRHTGAQPAHYGTFDGNKVHKFDAEVLDLASMLAF